MRNKIWGFIQYGYLVVALILFVEAMLKINTDRNSAIMILVFSFLFVFLFFFKRRFRKKIEERGKEK